MKSHKLPGLHEHMHHSRLVARAPHAAQARPRRSTTRGKVGGGPLERDSFTPERGRCARRSVGAPSRFHGLQWAVGGGAPTKESAMSERRSQKFAGQKFTRGTNFRVYDRQRARIVQATSGNRGSPEVRPVFQQRRHTPFLGGRLGAQHNRNV
jgi:hypothetical protein